MSDTTKATTIWCPICSQIITDFVEQAVQEKTVRLLEVERLAGELADNLEKLDVAPLASDYRRGTTIKFSDWYGLRSRTRELQSAIAKGK